AGAQTRVAKFFHAKNLTQLSSLRRPARWLGSARNLAPDCQQPELHHIRNSEWTHHYPGSFSDGREFCIAETGLSGKRNALFRRGDWPDVTRAPEILPAPGRNSGHVGLWRGSTTESDSH